MLMSRLLTLGLGLKMHWLSLFLQLSLQQAKKGEVDSGMVKRQLVVWRRGFSLRIFLLKEWKTEQ